MWAFVMVLFSFFSVTIIIIALIFLLNHLYFVVMALLTLFFTYFSFEIKNLLWEYLKPLLHNFVQNFVQNFINFVQNVVQILPVGSNVKALTREFEILDKKLKDVQEEIDKDEASMKKPTEEVEGWMKRVQALQPSVESVVTACANQSYLRNIYSISIEAVNKLKEVRQEAEFIKSARAYTRAAPPPMVQEVPTTTLAAPGGEIELKLRMALDFLRDDAQKTLGVWGMGGVGKTTLLKRIKSAMMNGTSFWFDPVVLVTASRGFTMGKIQMSIAKELGLSDGGDYYAKIYKYLRHKSFIILVDDLWDFLRIEEMGIPLPLGVIEGHKRKMILVSRDHQVLNNMGASQSIRVECLMKEMKL